MELLSAQQKREFFEELEELLRPSRRRRLKPGSSDSTLISQTTGTRQQATYSPCVIVEKECLPILGEQLTTELTTPAPVEMRDLKKLGALQQEKRPPERKTKGSAAKKAKHDTSVDPETLLLTGKHVLLVPFGPDMGRKRLEILQSLVEKMGGNVVQSLLKTSTRAGVGSGKATAVKWSEVSLIIMSGQLTREKAAEFLHIDTFPPANIEVYIPEWLVYLRREKKFPPAGSMLTWTEQQEVQEEAAKHEQHCEKVAQQLEEKRAKNNASDESEDEGSDLENSGTRDIVRAPPVQINSEDVREQQAELNENNRKLVEERTPIFYKNNPGFRPINETAVPDSKKIKGDGFICQRSSGT
ncbi:hypothetical protein DVH05_023889 [Phytophthora capsici]|nr:hypothetical protein DVH05_023889 [Phytophthora capsici]